MGTSNIGSLQECQFDCDTYADCEGVLYCTQDFPNSYWNYYGLDTRKAYCEKPNGRWNEEVCFDPYKVYDDANKLDYCQGDCDKNSDCHFGLLCADEYKDELEALGFDPRKANCTGPDIGGETVELCFYPYEVGTPYPPDYGELFN